MIKDERLEQQEVGDAEIKQMLNDIEYYQKRVEELEQPLTRDWKETIDERIANDDKFKKALAQPAQEPVAIVYSMQDGYIGQMVVKDIPHKTKLYTHPAPSWQGLTAKEIASIPLNEYTVQTVERMLKEKNT